MKRIQMGQVSPGLNSCTETTLFLAEASDGRYYVAMEMIPGENGSRRLQLPVRRRNFFETEKPQNPIQKDYDCQNFSGEVNILGKTRSRRDLAPRHGSSVGTMATEFIKEKFIVDRETCLVELVSPWVVFVGSETPLGKNQFIDNRKTSVVVADVTNHLTPFWDTGARDARLVVPKIKFQDVDVLVNKNGEKKLAKARELIPMDDFPKPGKLWWQAWPKVANGTFPEMDKGLVFVSIERLAKMVPLCSSRQDTILSITCALNFLLTQDKTVKRYDEYRGLLGGLTDDFPEIAALALEESSFQEENKDFKTGSTAP